MRFSHASLLSLALALACPLWLAGCNPATPPSAAEDVPPPMSGPVAPQPPGDRIGASTPDVPAASLPEVARTVEAEGGAHARIDTLLGDAAQYEQVFKALQQAVASDDRAAVAALVRYPLSVEIDGSKHEIADAAAFQRDYERIVTAPVARAIASQSFDTVFANWQGVMIGNGQVWLNGKCLDPACGRSEVKVVAIQE